MRSITIAGAVILAAFLGWSVSASAQEPGLEVPLQTPGPGWKTCPRCENPAHVADDRKKADVDTRQFDPHDLSGVWGNNGIHINNKNRPPFTPAGQKMYDDLAKQFDQKDEKTSALKDPLLGCDPLGSIRGFGYNYGVEFVQTPTRVFEFFEWSHTWRTIWTDGRQLPKDPPVERFLGYDVGHWDGNTFVVESNGYDDRAYISSDSTTPLFPHSPDMRVEERYTRVNYGQLQASITITDPTVYTEPWTTTGMIQLLPNAELWEYFCVPSESGYFNSNQEEIK